MDFYHCISILGLNYVGSSSGYDWMVADFTIHNIVPLDDIHARVYGSDMHALTLQLSDIHS